MLRRSQRNEFQRRIDRLIAAGKRMQDRALQAEDQVRSLDQHVRDLVTERDKYAGEAQNARHMAELLLREVSTLSQQLGRTPEVVVESILAGIAPLFLGYKDATANQQTKVQEIITAMGSQGLDHRMGVDDKTYFPDVEFDSYMEDEGAWPRPNEMDQRVTSRQTNPSTTNYQISEEGVARKDGQPMFRSGMTGPPPASSVE